jgi:hypothetical protein
MAGLTLPFSGSLDYPAAVFSITCSSMGGFGVAGSSFGR